MFTLGMEELVTLGVVGLILLGVHAIFAVYLYRSLIAERDRTERFGDTFARGESVSEPDFTASETSSSEEPNGGESSTLRCPSCGASNDPAFRFCRRCVSDLSESSTPYGAAAGGSSD